MHSFETDPAKRARWRPISEFHEELQPVVVVHIEDPGGVAVAWSDDITSQSYWTHFAELPLLTSEMGAELLETHLAATKQACMEVLRQIAQEQK